MSNRSRLSRGMAVLLTWVLALAMGTITSSAQTFRGSILGSVTDSSGAAVEGAHVLVKNPATGLERTSVTSSDGSYLVPELPIGTYNVTVTMTSFQAFIASGVQVTVASQKRVDVS